MLTLVGAMSGYCSIGSEKNAPIPLSITMIASTQAKIGRSMKIRDMASLPGLVRAGLPRTALPGRGNLLRCTGRYRPDLHVVPDVVAEALGDHAVARLEALGHHPVGAAGAHGRNLAAHRLVVRADDVDES